MRGNGSFAFEPLARITRTRHLRRSRLLLPRDGTSASIAGLNVEFPDILGGQVQELRIFPPSRGEKLVQYAEIAWADIMRPGRLYRRHDAPSPIHCWPGCRPFPIRFRASVILVARFRTGILPRSALARTYCEIQESRSITTIYAYYEGDLWDRRRWAAIWNMNLGRYEALLEPAKREIRAMLPYHEIEQPIRVERFFKIVRRIALHPNDPLGYRYRGALFAVQNEPDLAIQDFSRVLELEPDNAFTYCDRAAQYAKKYELDKAIADYGRAIELNPGLVSAYIGRGEVYGKQKRWNAAIADLNRAVDLDPGQTDAYLNRGAIYRERPIGSMRWMISSRPFLGPR